MLTFAKSMYTYRQMTSEFQRNGISPTVCEINEYLKMAFYQFVGDASTQTVSTQLQVCKRQKPGKN